VASSRAKHALAETLGRIGDFQQYVGVTRLTERAPASQVLAAQLFPHLLDAKTQRRIVPLQGATKLGHRCGTHARLLRLGSRGERRRKGIAPLARTAHAYDWQRIGRFQARSFGATALNADWGHRLSMHRVGDGARIARRRR